jgi:hypothetical protein
VHNAIVRSVSLVKVASCLSAVFIVVACASSEETSDQPTAEPTPNEPATKIPPASMPEEKAPEKQCVAKCTTDKQCADSCPDAKGSGVNCCDVNTGTCYANGTGKCPKPPVEDSGAPPPAY